MTTLAPDTLSTLTPYPSGPVQWRACAVSGCPNIYLANVCGYDQDKCPAHREPSKHAQHKSKAPHHQNRWQPVTITHDPLPLDEGGFTPGAPFDLIDFVYMLMEGALTVGLTVTHAGTGYTVTGENELTRADGRRYRGTSKHCLEEIPNDLR
jgi:hypothetical protein